MSRRKPHSLRYIRSYDHDRGTVAELVLPSCRCGWEGKHWTRNKGLARQEYAAHLEPR